MTTRVELEKSFESLEKSANKAMALIDRLREDRATLFSALIEISKVSHDEKVLEILERTLVALQ